MQSIDGRFQTGPIFSVVGHRGFMARYPENSLISFAQAEAAGVAELELDIWPSVDGELIVNHDPTFSRVALTKQASPFLPVSELSLAQIRAVTLESGQPAPTFREVCEATSTNLQVELKDPGCVVALERFFTEVPEAAARVYFMSFDIESLELLLQAFGDLPRGLILPGGEPQRVAEVLSLLDRVKASRVGCHWDGMSAELVSAVRASGREVHVWPLRTKDDVRRALDLGVDGGTTDDPVAVNGWIAELTGA